MASTRMSFDAADDHNHSDGQVHSIIGLFLHACLLSYITAGVRE